MRNNPQHEIRHTNLWHLSFLLILLGVGLALILFPIFLCEKPAGDSFISVLYAKLIKRSERIPIYDKIASFYGQPGSLYATPALHIFHFWLSELTGLTVEQSVLASVTLTGITMILLIYFIGEELGYGIGLFSIFILICFSKVWWRFFFEPGFHYQNLIGDLLVLSFILSILMIRKNESTLTKITSTSVIILMGVSSILFHALSALVIYILILPCIFILDFYKVKYYIKLKRSEQLWVFLMLLIFILLVFAIIKIAPIEWFIADQMAKAHTPYAFVFQSLPSIEDYPDLIGNTIFFLGIAGTITVLIQIIRTKIVSRSTLLVMVWLVITLLLSRAPQIGIQLHPVRLLYFANYPLSVMGGFFLWKCWRKIRKKLYVIILFFLILSPECMLFINYFSSSPSYLATNLSSRFNSDIDEINQWLRENIKDGDTILFDYYERSTIWLLPGLLPYFSVYLHRITDEDYKNPLPRILSSNGHVYAVISNKYVDSHETNIIFNEQQRVLYKTQTLTVIDLGLNNLNVALAALGANASASSIHKGIYIPLRAIDGDLETQWSGENNQKSYWFQVKLLQPLKISTVIIHWNGSLSWSGRRYFIQFSNDSITWVMPPKGYVAYDDQSSHIFRFQIKAQYIKITIVEWYNSHPSIRELEVYCSDS